MINKAKTILLKLGLPVQQQNDISALTLLALSGLDPKAKWEKATNKSNRITDLKNFINTNYRVDNPYAENTRESFRKQVLRQFREAGLVVYNPDDPGLSVNSPKAHYALTDECLHLLQAFGTKAWEKSLNEWTKEHSTLQLKYAAPRNNARHKATVNGSLLQLSPGAHNELEMKVLQDFICNFAQNAEVWYCGDAENKAAIFEKGKFKKILGITLTEHDKLPDVILYDSEHKWLYLIEAVTSVGPVSPQRLLELERIFNDKITGKVYVTAFLTKEKFKSLAAEIAWETEVWIADNPTHMIHFNGDRFIGPHQTANT